MTTYAVTGATGHLGTLVIEDLLAAGVPASDIVAIARSAEKASGLADRGVVIRLANYSDPQTLPAALAGVDVLLLISGSEVGHRITQHGAVIDAAKAAGVGRIAYTSVLRADTSTLPVAPDHLATEELIRASGVPFTFLRNGWYTENYTDRIGEYVGQGVIVAAAADGRIAAAPRADFALAAAAALTGAGHENAVYELAGPSFSLKELAAAVTEVTGTEVAYHEVSTDELVGILTGVGLDDGTAQFVAAIDTATVRGDLESDSTDLQALIGRPVTSITEALRAAV
jgi:NAD(P)H dehydrogenase (quinone)